MQVAALRTVCSLHHSGNILYVFIKDERGGDLFRIWAAADEEMTAWLRGGERRLVRTA